MSTFQIGVIDLNCEQSDRSFFPPAIKLTTVSTTTIGHILGFPEYAGFESNPKKKYHTITWQGFSEQDVFTDATLATQIAGARFDWSGASTIDSKGHYLSTYSKNLSEMCNAADGLCVGIADQVGAGFNKSYPIMGWMGAPNTIFGVVDGCSIPGIPFTPQGDKALRFDQPALYDSTPLSSGIDPKGNYIKTFKITSSITASDVSSGSQEILTAGALAPSNKVIPFPCSDTIQGISPISVILTWNSNYSSLLYDEYTESEALANGLTFVSNGSTAGYIRQGFQISKTGVDWTIVCSNLIVGQSYVATYQTVDQSFNTTTNTVAFIATDTKFTITGSLPTQSIGNTLSILNPKVSFA